MDASIVRILDANFNRAREALRVLEEHARMVLADEALARRGKDLRHELAVVADSFGWRVMLTARDIRGDVGTNISTDAEARRQNPGDVASAAAKRAGEALRCIEEYGKIVSGDAARRAQRLRYELYALEQDILLGGPRRRRLAEARLHVLVTEALCRHPWWDVCERALAGGADVIQLREKGLCDRELVERARRLRQLTARHDRLLIINDRADIACLADADGVHLGLADLSPTDARRIVGANRLVGATAHSIDEAQEAIAQSPDYLAVGAVFASATRPDVAVGGPGLVAEIRKSCPLPLVAIGGITAANAADLLEALREHAGAPGSGPQAVLHVAVCRSVIAAEDVETTVRTMRVVIEAFNARA